MLGCGGGAVQGCGGRFACSQSLSGVPSAATTLVALVRPPPPKSREGLELPRGASHPRGGFNHESGTTYPCGFKSHLRLMILCAISLWAARSTPAASQIGFDSLRGSWLDPPPGKRRYERKHRVEAEVYVCV